MAYHDLNGTITIDEVAAQADIQKEAAAVEILRQASVSLSNVIAECGSWQGETINALADKSSELQTQIASLISTLENCQSYTRNVVERYRQIDLQWKTIMQQ